MNPSTSQSHTPIPVQEDSLSLLPPSKVFSLDSTMAVPVVRFPVVLLVRFIGVVVAALVFTWAVHYRGGLALISENKDLIFNVIFLLSILCSDLYALMTEKISGRKGTAIADIKISSLCYLKYKIRDLTRFSFFFSFSVCGAAGPRF